MNVMLLFLYGMTHLIDTKPGDMTIFSIDVFVGVTFSAIIIRNIFLSDAAVFFLVAPALSFFRAAAGMLYMDIPKTFAWNVLLSATRCWKFHSNANVLKDDHTVYSRSIFFGVEIVSLAAVMLTCLI